MDIKTLSRFLRCTGLLPMEFLDNNDFRRTRTELQVSHRHLFISLFQLIMLILMNIEVLNWVEILRFSAIVAFIRCMDVGWVAVGLVLPIVRLKKIAVCLSRAFHILDSVSDHSSMTGCYHLVLGNISFQAAMSLLIQVLFGRTTLLHLLISFANFSVEMMPMMVNCCIVTLLQVIITSYSEVNRRISVVADERSFLEVFSSEELAALAQRHWDTGTLMQHVNRTLGLHVVILCAYTLVKLAFLLYFTFVLRFFHQNDVGVFIIFVTISSTMYLLTNMLIMSTKAEAAVTERKKTLGLLYRLLRRKSENMKYEARQQIRIFQVQLKARDIHLSASGLFNVNRTMFFGLVTQIVSYFIVLVQFKVFQRW